MPNVINLKPSNKKPNSAGAVDVGKNGGLPVEAIHELPLRQNKPSPNPASSRPRNPRKSAKIRVIIAAVFVAIIVVVLSFVLFKKQTQPTQAASWFDDNWHYRASFDVFNASTTADLVDFQVEIATSTLGLYASWSNGKIKNDFSDLRFTDAGGNLLDYWFADATSTMRDVYIKFPNLPKNATSTLYMYYGNSSATDAKDGQKIFPQFFEDFSNGYTSRPWTKSSGTFTIGGAQNEKYLKNTADGELYTPSTLAYGVWEFDWYKGGDDSELRYYFIADLSTVSAMQSSGNGYLFWDTTGEAVQVRRLVAGAGAAVMSSAVGYVLNNKWYRVKIKRSPGGQFTTYLNDVLLDTTGGSGANPATNNQVTSSIFSVFYVGSSSGDDRLDNIVYRKFAESDPNVAATAGTSEEIGTAPVGYWSFNEGYGTTAYDSSSYKNNGTLTNMTTTGTSTAWVTGKVGKALMFDNSNDTIPTTITDNVNFTGGFTIAAWIKPDSVGETHGRIVDKSDDLSATNGFYFSMYTNNNLAVRVNAGTTRSSAFNSITFGVWQYVLVTFASNSTITFYINGVRASALGTTGALSGITTSNPLTIGNAVGATSRTFDGLIDEVKIYNYVLTAAQIKAEYNKGKSVVLGAGLPPEEAEGLVGWWKMDESTTAWDGAGDQVNDYSGNGNNGTASGNAHATTTAQYGNAGEFDGANDFVTLPAGATLASQSQVTISAWIMPKSFAIDSARVYVEQTSGTNYNRIGFDLSNTGFVNLRYRDSTRDPTGAVTVVTSNTALSLNVWTHVAVVYDAINDTQKVYLNGYLDKAANNKIEPLGSSVSIGIKIGDSAGSNEYDGLVDDLKVYKTARTPDQIMMDYLMGPSPMAYWDFNEGTGTTLYDKSGQGNNSVSFEGGLGAKEDWVQGKYGRALDFDGADDYVGLGDPNSLNFTDGSRSDKAFSVSAWIKMDDATFFRLFTKDAASDVAEYIFTGNSDNKLGLFLYNNGALGSNQISSVTDNIITAYEGSWIHVVATYNGSESQTGINLYINGVRPAQTQSLNGTYAGMANTAASVQIGRTVYQGDYANGIIDEVKVYDYALTPWQIAQEYNAGKPLAHWSFDDGYGTTANNSSDNTKSGALTNMSTTGTSTAWVLGKFGKALLFDGVNDTVSITDTTGSSLDIATHATLSAWIKPSNVAGSKYIIDKDDTTAYALMLNGSSLVGYFDIGGSNSCSGGTVKANEWQHVSATYDGSYIRCYINGKEVGKTADSGSIDTQDTALYIGSDGGAANYFNGLIDEVKIYHYALSPIDLRKEYNDGASVKLGLTPEEVQNSQQGLVAWYRINETPQKFASTTNNNRINDYSGNGNNLISKGWTAGADGPQATTTAVYGNAAQLDGVDDYLCSGSGTSCADDNDLDMGADNFTIEFWAKIAADSFDIFLGKRNSLAAAAGYVFWHDATDNEIKFEIANSSGSEDYASVASTPYLGAWHYFTGVADRTNKTLRFYIDGEQKNTSSIINNLTTNLDNSEEFAIGGDGGQRADRFYGGLIDDVKIYKTARPPDQILQDYLMGPGSIASYNFEEKSGATVNDLSGQGHSGAITAGASSGFVKGKIGRAYDFDGANTKVDTGSEWIGTQNVSVSAWIKIDGYGEGPSLGKIIYNGKFGFGVNGVGANMYIDFTNDGSATKAVSATGSILTGTWYFVTMTRNGTTINLYVNGVLSGTANQTVASPVAGTYNVIIGNSNGQDRTFDGIIDDLKVYNYVLTPWQIAQEYNGGKPMAHWKMDEGENKTIYDWSGKGYNGALSLGGSPATSTAWQAETSCTKGKCLSFDGTDDTVSITDTTGSSLDIANHATLSAWIKPSNVAGSKYIIDKDDTAAYALMLNGSSLVGYFDIGGSNSCSGGTVRANEWQHVSATYDGSYIRCYINGKEVGKTADSGSIDTQDTTLYIGSDGGAANYFNGLIDEVKIYHYALSPIDIREDYNSGYGTYFK